MKNGLAVLSVICGLIAGLLVFTPYFNTPPLTIIIFSISGMILASFSLKAPKPLAILSFILNSGAFLYLIYSFITLGG